MPPNAEYHALDEALTWHARLLAGGEEEWQAFTEWLERDLVHVAAYDRVSLADAALDDVLKDGKASAPAVAPQYQDNSTQLRRWPRMTAFAAAAAAVLALVSYSLAPRKVDYLAVETAAGQQRTIALVDGSRIYLNGGTRVLIERGRARLAKVERGEAAFEVVHDERNPFTVLVKDAKVEDVGTVFDVAVDAKGYQVAVAEGAVLFNPGAESIKLTPGGKLRVTAQDNVITLGSAPSRGIGSWRRGYLIYDGEPLQSVAADLSRTLGVEVSLAPAVAFRPFSGAIAVDRDQARLFRRLEGLLGVRATRAGNGWRLDAA